MSRIGRLAHEGKAGTKNGDGRNVELLRKGRVRHCHRHAPTTPVALCHCESPSQGLGYSFCVVIGSEAGPDFNVFGLAEKYTDMTEGN